MLTSSYALTSPIGRACCCHMLILDFFRGWIALTCYLQRVRRESRTISLYKKFERAPYIFGSCSCCRTARSISSSLSACARLFALASQMLEPNSGRNSFSPARPESAPVIVSSFSRSQANLACLEQPPKAAHTLAVRRGATACDEGARQARVPSAL
jgi:hypothetical protein